jgi:hypothetical protein
MKTELEIRTKILQLEEKEKNICFLWIFTKEMIRYHIRILEWVLN